MPLTMCVMALTRFGGNAVNKYLLLTVLLLSIVATGIRVLKGAPVVDSDIGIFPTLPDWGKVCITSDVRGGPDVMYPVLYSVVEGTHVRLHDQSRPDGTWVSIAPAQWIPLSSLCWK